MLREGDVLRATFRLDSLSADGSLAYLTVKGEVSRDARARGGHPDGDMEMRGTMTGMLLLDRARGWLRESRVSMILNTTLFPARSTGNPPMRFVTRISQRVRTLDR